MVFFTIVNDFTLSEVGNPLKDFETTENKLCVGKVEMKGDQLGGYCSVQAQY